MNDLYTKLQGRGWSHADLSHAAAVLHQAESNKGTFIRFLDVIAYWFVLLTAIVGNIVVSVILVPFFLVFHPLPLYLMVIAIAATFGWLFTTLLQDLENLQQKEHIIGGLFIPAIAVINVFFIVSFSNHLAGTIRVNEVTHNPLIVSFFYVAAFVAPYLWGKYRKGSESRVAGGRYQQNLVRE